MTRSLRKKDKGSCQVYRLIKVLFIPKVISNFGENEIQFLNQGISRSATSK